MLVVNKLPCSASPLAPLASLP